MRLDVRKIVGIFVLTFWPITGASAQNGSDMEEDSMPAASTPTELAGVLARFDTDRDGALSFAEFRRLRELQFARLDENSDGALTPEEAGPGVSIGGQRNPKTAFQWADTDFNGLLSQYEFVEAPIPVLTRLDADFDGKLTADELSSGRSRGSNM